MADDRRFLVTLKVAVKNNVGVFYFACLVPIHVLFTAAGEMEKMVFLATWKDIPAENEQQFALTPLSLDAGALLQLLVKRSFSAMPLSGSISERHPVLSRDNFTSYSTLSILKLSISKASEICIALMVHQSFLFFVFS